MSEVGREGRQLIEVRSGALYLDFLHRLWGLWSCFVIVGIVVLYAPSLHVLNFNQSVRIIYKLFFMPMYVSTLKSNAAQVQDLWAGWHP